MKYIINGKFLSQELTGVQRYAREIILELDKLIPKGFICLAIPVNGTQSINLENIEIRVIGKHTGTVWEQIDFPRYAKKNQLIPINLCGPSPISFPGIVVLHDVTFKAYPETFTKRFRLWYEILFRNSLKKAKCLVTISKFSENEIKKYYHSDRTFKIIPNAWQHFDRIHEDRDTLSRYRLIAGNYYFTLGSLKPNKNLSWIAECAKQNPGELFVVAGGVNEKNFENGMGFSVPSNMKLIGYVGDEEAKELMSKCKVFLFPSLYEGFGIPPLEALSSGCKRVLVSDIPVMHEIFGDAISYITDYNLYCKESDNSVLGMFSWKESARLLLDILLNNN